MGPTRRLLALTLALTVMSPSLASADECRFPPQWVGQWYWKETVFNITETRLGSKGRCIENDGFMYLFEKDNSGGKCYACVVLFLRHTNIIEFKESRFCHRRRVLRDVCVMIGGDEPLHTMIRVGRHALPVPCPFRGHFTFHYRRSANICSEPISRVTSCAAAWHLMLHHQACPDVAGAERLSEKLTCLATWRSHNAHFMFGRLDSVKTKTDADRYRCFIYDQFDLDGRRGYHVVQSGDSTCQGLQSVTEGHKVMTFYDDKQIAGKCRLPVWLAEHHEWHSMDGSQRYHIFHRNHSIKITGATPSSSVVASNASTKLICIQQVEATDSRVKLVFYSSRDCTSGYQCAVLYKRDGHVVEVKFGDLAPSSDNVCQYFDERHHNFTTLISGSHAGHPCPYLGRHAVIGVKREGRTVRDTCSGAFTTLVMGCSRSDTLQLRSECRRPPQSASLQSTEYRCHGNWEENGTHFLVTSPISESESPTRRVCFVSMATSEGLHFSTLQEACYRNISLRQDGALAFNVTINGDCRAEASTTRSGSNQLTRGAVSWLLSCLLLVVR